MKTFADAKAAYIRAQRTMPVNYVESMGKFFGSPIATGPGTPGGNYQSAVSGPEAANKWERNLRNKFVG